jgi:hypothetical protein
MRTWNFIARSAGKGMDKMTKEEREQIYGELLNLASQMLMRHNMPSPIADDWDLPQSTSHKTWFKVLDAAGKADEQSRVWGVKVGEIADKIMGRKQ